MIRQAIAFAFAASAGAANVAASTAALPIPAAVLRAGPALTAVARVKDLPPGAISAPMADPGGRFNGGDTLTPGLPSRGLVVAGCTRDVCVMQFTAGGLEPTYCIAAVERRDDRWPVVWRARLSRSLASLADLQSALAGKSTAKLSNASWCDP